MSDIPQIKFIEKTATRTVSVEDAYRACYKYLEIQAQSKRDKIIGLLREVNIESQSDAPEWYADKIIEIMCE